MSMENAWSVGGLDRFRWKGRKKRDCGSSERISRKRNGKRVYGREREAV